MIKKYVKILLFLSSYIPLFLIIGIKNHTSLLILILMFLLITITSIVLWRVLDISKKMDGEFKKIYKVDNKSNKSMNYIFAYIIPFLRFDVNILTDFISIFIIFIIVGYLYIRSDLIYINPVMSFLGYNIYEINKDGFILITQKNISKGKSMKIFKITKNVGVL